MNEVSTQMEGIKKWLIANPLVVVALRYVVPPLLAGVLVLLGILGLVPADVVAACRAALGR